MSVYLLQLNYIGTDYGMANRYVILGGPWHHWPFWEDLIGSIAIHYRNLFFPLRSVDDLSIR
jgi:hypothetical protein